MLHADKEEELFDERLKHQLPIDRRRLSNGEVSLREPINLGLFTIKKLAEDGTSSRIFVDNDSELSVINLPRELNNVHYDLSDGYIKLQDGGRLFGMSSHGLKELLQWILAHRAKFALASRSPTASFDSLHTDFITYRGVLTNIMCTPYENQNEWLIGATKYKGTIYLYAFETEDHRRREENRDDHQNLMCFGGFRFESYITSPFHKVEEPEPSGDKVQGNKYQHHDELCCMVRTRIKDHSLVYGAEMDCVEKNIPVEKLKLNDFIEIKTTKTIHNQKQFETLCRFKMNKWWAQSYLIGCSKLVCGYRDDDMVVRSIEKFNVNDFPRMGQSYWSNIVCLNFLDQFLSFVKKCVTEDEAIYKFYYKPRSNITCTKTNDKKFEVLPEWYKEALVTSL